MNNNNGTLHSEDPKAENNKGQSASSQLGAVTHASMAVLDAPPTECEIDKFDPTTLRALTAPPNLLTMELM